MGNAASSTRTQFHPTQCCSYKKRETPTPRKHYHPIKKRHVKKFKERRDEKVKRPKRDMHDTFHFRSVVGRGGFGTVICLTDTLDGAVKALKCMNKVRASKDGSRECVERDLMYELESPLTIALYATGESQYFFKMLLEFRPGGDLKALTMRYGSWDEPVSKFFAAQIVLAVDYLQKCRILHRDLKPENIFMDMGGYAKLGDFGLARRMPAGERSTTWVGTVAYMAPEVLLELPYGLSPDCFALGCIIYEFVFGKYPFGAEEDERRKRLDEKPFFDKGTSELHSLLSGLLKSTPNNRLGVYGRGFYRILKHKWFKDVNWLTLYYRRYQCPIQIYPGQGWMFSQYELHDNPKPNPGDIICDF